MKFICGIFFMIFMFTSCSSEKKQYMLVGTYTGGKSIGIYVYEFNAADKTSRLVDSVKASNPSFLAISPDEKFVYSVNELGQDKGGGQVTAYSFDKKTGKLTQLNQQSAYGDDPCYITVDKTGNWVLVGNYSSGSATVLSVNNDGSLGDSVSVVQHVGHGPDSSRQKGPHVHATVLSPGNDFLFVPDLGLDKIMTYTFNENTGKLRSAKDSFIKLADASGPRHFSFHPSGKWAYLMQELNATVTAFSYANGKTETIQTISSLPDDYKGPSSSADIHVSPDGKFLYASNRDASNTIAIFKIDQQNGKLSIAGYQSTLGSTPRNFNFDPSGDYLLVANQKTDNIVVFKIDHETGLLTDTGQRIDVGNPVCIKWIIK